MRSERLPSIPQMLRTASISRRSVQLSEETRAQLAAMKKTVRRGITWSLLFRRMRLLQQKSAITKNFQMRVHNTTDLVVTALEVFIALASALQLGLTYKAPLWRQNRACAERDDCTIDLPDGSFRLANCVRIAMLVLGLTRAWIRIRFILKSLKGGRRHPSRGDWQGKLVLEVLSIGLFPFPGVERVVGRHASAVFLLLTLAVGVRPIFWRQLTYFPYPIRQQEKVASFSGNLEFTYRSFVFKRVMDNNPLFKIELIAALLILFGTYVIHIAETMDGACVWPASALNTPVTSSSAVCDELSVVDAFWLLCTTIVPLGFGDIVPRTNAGRVLVVLPAIVAVCLNAMFFSTIIRKFSFSSMEARVHAFLYRMELYGKKDMSAVLAVQATFRFHKSYKRSLIWHQQQSSSVLYRPLSARLPNEVKKKLYISRFQASLKGIMKYDTDGDPLNAFVKHIEVITAALGMTFMDITRLKKISNRRPNALEYCHPKLLRSTFMAAAAFNPSHYSSTKPPSSDAMSALSTSTVRNSGVGSALAASGAVTTGIELQQAISLPSRVEEPQLAPQRHSLARFPKPSMAALGIFSSTGGVPAAWAEEMLHKCEETLATLRRIEHDAKAIL